ncbi:tyrosine-type recombinase/integrase [Ponticoccus alexandrii]|uniref:Tyrosine-type recombinase/integrase n=2 Tax=Ponticoccus alexandrii TaxID=1943633 RepID=A0ABX7F761_9RHOB|nr:site-specific integrase [Ponticoccus alexandrii]ETA54011.2 integrase [Rhodobacteraceae bacterium PD-2]QRF66345.1 tyrosine-type recombinase/integrase [Ponticoccus alexandrii]
MPDISIGRFRGGFCVYWRKPDGKRTRHGLAARTREDAEAEAIEVYRRVTYASAPRGATVADLWAEYVEDLGDKPTATTMGYTGKAILPHFGAYLPENITKVLCVSYARTRADAGKSQGTIWTELGHLQTALNFARDVRRIDRAPKIWRPAKPEKDKRILNKGEARALLDGAREPHIRLALALLLGTGARIGAILDLEWDRVDFERGTINLRLADAKTRKGRSVVPMNSGTRAALDVAQRAALTDFVVEYAGGPVKSIRKGFTAAVERAKIGHVRIHDLRHTAAVWMLSEGVPIEKVAQVLGHSNISVTYRTYGRYLPEHMQDAVNVLDFTTLKDRA